MPSRLPRLFAVIGLAVTVVTLAAACSQQSADKSGTAPVAVPQSTEQFGDGPAPEVTTTPVGTGTTTAAKAPKSAPLADGRWPGFVTKAGGGTVTMDLVEFLTGDAAAKAWQQKYPDSDLDGPDNDYLVVNDNTKLRKLTLSPDVEVRVVGATGPGAEQSIAVSALAKHFGSTLKSSLFWFTVEQGEVTRIEQQFLP